MQLTDNITTKVDRTYNKFYVCIKAQNLIFTLIIGFSVMMMVTQPTYGRNLQHDEQIHMKTYTDSIHDMKPRI